MQKETETMNSESTVQRYGGQGRRCYATREWHCRGGVLTRVRGYVLYESRESRETFSK